MKRSTIAIISLGSVLGLTLGTTGSASASIVTSTSGPGSVDSVFDGAVTFTGYGSGSLSSTVIEKSLTGFGNMVVTVGYDSGDTDFIFPDSSSVSRSGLRWGEVITNDTGVAWTGYSISLGGTDGHEFVLDSGFSGGYIPNYAAISGLPAGPVTVTLMSPATSTTGAGGEVTISGATGSLVLSPDRTSLTFDFATPLADSSSFGVWISPLVKSTSGAFTLTQSASPVPEPSTFIVWSLLGALALTIGWWRRKR